MNIKFPILISLAGIFLGIFIAILFGINEDIFKDKIAKGLELNQKYQSITEPAEKSAYKDKEAAKNWRYYQRFHFHGTAINSMSIGLIVLLLLVNVSSSLQIKISYLIAISGFLYPFVWLFAGIYGPELGRSVAKEKFAVFGYMGGLYLLGVVIIAFLVGRKGVSQNLLTK